MPIKTALTDLFGIQHPILSAPMDVIAGARLTAAVSAAGRDHRAHRQRGRADFARAAQLVRSATGLS
jgi:NAD(P)H-dependent flavin oxidoreductase YrpB (nitropropane dioxygenase family)